MNATDTLSAADAYADRRAAIDEKLAELIVLLDEHDQKRAAKPRDWGWTGDLTEVNAKLREAVAFLRGEE